MRVKKNFYQNLRFYFVCSLFFLVFVFLVARLYDLQIKKFDFYFAKASFLGQDKDAFKIRGGIFVKKGLEEELIPVAINKNFFTVYAVPKEIKEKERTSLFLANLLNAEKPVLFERISKINDPYEAMANKVSEEVALKIKNLNLTGVYIKPEPLRFYPFLNSLSHVLGFTSLDFEEKYVGRYGLESHYDKDLSSGADLILSIDQNIQLKTEEVLSGLISRWGAERGIILIEDPKTGKIIAAAAYPNFDPNEFNKFPLDNFLNPAVENVYEPGSVFKVITMAAALNSGSITSDTVYIDRGQVVINGRTIKNWDFDEKGARGKQTMADVLAKSLNTGVVFAEDKLGHDLFAQYVRDFGFGDKTGIDLPGEIGGNIRNLKSFRDINFATASFGQGISVTPIELIGALSAIANEGKLMKPYVTEKIINQSGATIIKNPEIIRQVIKPETAAIITSMMVKAVESGKIAVIDGYDIAGKTGTAQIPNFGGKGYSSEYIHSFGGFAPAWDPKFTILIKLDKPKGAKLSGMTVVPAFRELTQFLLNYYNILPH